MRHAKTNHVRDVVNGEDCFGAKACALCVRFEYGNEVSRSRASNKLVPSVDGVGSVGALRSARVAHMTLHEEQRIAHSAFRKPIANASGGVAARQAERVEEGAAFDLSHE